MREFWKFWNNGKGGGGVCWTQAAALEWRTGFGVSLNQAFEELVELRTKERDRGRAAIGRKLNPDPERADDELIHYQPMQDRPISLPFGTPSLGVIPADDWRTFRLVVDADGHPTSSLEYAASRIPAWSQVEFDYQSTIELWLALVRGKSKQKEQREIREAIEVLAASRDWSSLKAVPRMRRIEAHLGKKDGWCAPRTYYRALKDYLAAHPTNDCSAS
jgi:hypothetical protein